MKYKKIKVKAAPLNKPGREGMAKCTKEGSIARYITEDEAVEVEASPYYMRKIMLGELVEVKAAKRKVMKVSDKGTKPMIDKGV